MRNIPINGAAYKLFVTADPEEAEFMDKSTGELKKITTNEDIPRQIYRVTMFAKNQTPNRFGKLDSGMEIEVSSANVDLDTVREGVFVELVAPTMTPEAKLKKDNTPYLQMRWDAAAISPVSG